MKTSFQFVDSLTTYKRRETIEVTIGDLKMGAHHPIRIQSMTTVDTMDTQGSIEESIRMIESGCELVRITAPSIKEAKNLALIKKGLVERGYNTPLVADIHYTPNAAEEAARLIEKVRINPGNYVDKKKFEIIEYSDQDYNEELDRIREKFTPLVNICKEYGTAMRIGTNHGSLSDRIMSRYGDNPNGMVESALEFLRIAEDLNYYNIVLSMKSSNTQVMVQAYRLLAARLKEEGLKSYPFHLGVTEAGDGEDGRIKSAVGIGTLLEDGIGDTVRVSLTEDPEFEAPVAQALVDRYNKREGHKSILPLTSIPKSPYEYARRESIEVLNIGKDNVPRVIADLSQLETIKPEDLKCIGHYYIPLTDKWGMNDFGSDYVYAGAQKISFMLPNGLKEIVDYSIWKNLSDTNNVFPLLTVNEFKSEVPDAVFFLQVSLDNLSSDVLSKLKDISNCVLILQSSNEHAMAEMRRAMFLLLENEIQLPVVHKRAYGECTADSFQLSAATDVGGLLIDGLGDGILLTSTIKEKAASKEEIKVFNTTAFGVLQAARTRMTKTEYISCPSCGRTLFDLQETTALIRKRTDHLKGVKIGIMGCIVNGPGEMADADYGYVGSGKDRITLYRGQEVVKKGVHSDNAVDELIEIIRTDGNWLESEKMN